MATASTAVDMVVLGGILLGSGLGTEEVVVVLVLIVAEWIVEKRPSPAWALSSARARAMDRC